MHNFVTIAKEEKFNSYLSFVNRVFAIYIKWVNDSILKFNLKLQTQKLSKW